MFLNTNNTYKIPTTKIKTNTIPTKKKFQNQNTQQIGLLGIYK